MSVFRNGVESDSLSTHSPRTTTLSWTIPDGADQGTYQWILSTFDTSDTSALSLLPISNDTPWHSSSELALHHGARHVISDLPDLLQIKHRTYLSLRQALVPFTLVRPQQDRIIFPLLDALRATAIIAPFTEYERLRTSSPELSKRLSYWQVMLSIHEKPANLTPETPTYFEMHLLPSVPILTQCTHTQGTSSFHLLTEYTYLFEDGVLSVSDYQDPPRFTDFALPHTWSISTCACPKKTTFTIL